jgi:hypothetical protein
MDNSSKKNNKVPIVETIIGTTFPVVWNKVGTTFIFVGTTF